MNFPEVTKGDIDIQSDVKLYFVDYPYLIKVIKWWKVQYKKKYLESNHTIDDGLIVSALLKFVDDNSKNLIISTVGNITRILKMKLGITDEYGYQDTAKFEADLDKYFEVKTADIFKMLEDVLGKINYSNINKYRVTGKLKYNVAIYVTHCRSHRAHFVGTGMESTIIKHSIPVYSPTHLTKED